MDKVLSELRQHIARGIASHLVNPGDGRLLSASLQPRTDGGWIVTLHDISEQERLKKQLQDQNEQLDAALNNMSQGLAMFDAEQRLIVCNKRYAEMYGLTPEQVKPGTTVRQIFQYRLANGFYQVRTRRLRRQLGAGFGEVTVGYPGAGRRAHHSASRAGARPTAAASSRTRTSPSASSSMRGSSSSTSC